MKCLEKVLIIIALFPIFMIGTVLTYIVFMVSIFRDKEQAIRIAVGFDQLGNTALNGSEDETLSSRMGKKVEKGECKLCCMLCKLLSRIDPAKGDHCINSIERDE